MYAVTVTFHIDPARIDAFMLLMVSNAQMSKRHEPGCQQFDVCRDGNHVFLYEIYDDRAAFDLHLASPHFLSFDEAVQDMITSKQVHLFEEVIR